MLYLEHEIFIQTRQLLTQWSLDLIYMYADDSSKYIFF